MSDKKHIDRVFQEGFKDFEAKPSDAVWENIEAQLNQKKKKRRVIPIWWRYAGAAAILLIMLTLGRNYFNNSNEPATIEIVDTEDQPTSTIKNNSLKETDPLINPENVVTNNNAEVDDLKNPSQNNSEVFEDKINASNESSIADSGTAENQKPLDTKLGSTNKSNEPNSVLKTENKSVIASNSYDKTNKAIQNKKDESLIDTIKADEIINNMSDNNVVVAEANHEENSDTLIDENIEDNSLTIEEALDKNKDSIEKEEKPNRWRIAPNAAPVYYSSLGEGSSIDPQFNNNSKTGDVNMSYGIAASYAINKKLTIRSGINRVNLGYNTNDVVMFQSVGFSSSSGRSLRNVDVNNSKVDALNVSNIESISIINGEGLSASNSPESLMASNTAINQTLGFIEIPLEIQYNLLNKKLGINVIGGFSSFFLNNNEIFSEVDGGSRTLLGEANNINEVSYSANFGFGFNYNISKKIDLNLEPMFKYQINTFNNTSGDFKPYFIGVYTGFAIKF